MEVIVYDIFRRGSKDLVFTKEFNLPFIPQKGIRIIDNNDNGDEVILELDDERKRRVLIDYEYKNNRFIVDIVRNMLWEKNEEELDTFIEQHECLSWQKGPNFHQTEQDIRELINLNNS